MNKKGIFLIILITVLLLILVVVRMNNSKKEDESNLELLSGKHYVEMIVKNYGKITLELDADIAPITVTNFIDLVEDKFYDGLTFHRIISGFMIQGGESDKITPSIKGEFKANGIKNNLSHKRGVISMARKDGDYNSASTQFFIMHKDTPSLDGEYAAFGIVIDGMDVVDKIAKVEVIPNSNGTVETKKQPIIESIKVIEDYKKDDNNDTNSKRK